LGTSEYNANIVDRSSWHCFEVRRIRRISRILAIEGHPLLLNCLHFRFILTNKRGLAAAEHCYFTISCAMFSGTVPMDLCWLLHCDITKGHQVYIPNINCFF